MSASGPEASPAGRLQHGAVPVVGDSMFDFKHPKTSPAGRLPRGTVLLWEPALPAKALAPGSGWGFAGETRSVQPGYA